MMIASSTASVTRTQWMTKTRNRPILRHIYVTFSPAAGLDLGLFSVDTDGFGANFSSNAAARSFHSF